MDKEKIIKGLECCTFILGKRKCNECPYQPDNGCYQLQDDFHAMLKEQEVVKPKSKVRHGAYTQIQQFCGNCMVMLHGKPKYCSNCGMKMKWK